MTLATMPYMSERHTKSVAGGIYLERGCSCSNMAERHLQGGVLLELAAGPGASTLPALSASGSGMRRAISFRHGSASQQNRAVGSSSQLRQLYGAGPAAELPAQGRASVFATASGVPQQRKCRERTRARSFVDETQALYSMYGTRAAEPGGDPATLLTRRLSKSAFDIRTASTMMPTGGRCLVRTDSSSSRRRSCNSSLPPQLIAISDYLSASNVGHTSNSSGGGGCRARRLSTSESRGGTNGAGCMAAVQALGISTGGAGSASRVGSLRNGRMKSNTASGDSFFSAICSCPPSPPAGRHAAPRSFGCGQGRAAAEASAPSSGAADAVRHREQRVLYTGSDVAAGAVAPCLPWQLQSADEAPRTAPVAGGRRLKVPGGTVATVQLDQVRRSPMGAQRSGGIGISEGGDSVAGAMTDKTCFTGRRCGSSGDGGKTVGWTSVAKRRLLRKWVALKASVAAAFSPLAGCSDVTATP